MEHKFKIGEHVRYSTSGVCLVENITNMDILGDGCKKDFYVLKPTSSNSSTIYVPVDNENLTNKMIKVLTNDEVDSLIAAIPDNKLEWIEDKKKRSEVFKAIIKRCERAELLSMADCIYKKRAELKAIGKKLSSADDSILSQAESIIENEFSFALNLDNSKVGEYITDRLE